MKPAYVTGDHERYELRVAKKDYTCWTWQERDGCPEPDCQRMIGRGETYMLSTIYPGHESGYADAGWRPKLTWGPNNEVVWEREVVPARPIGNRFCLACCARWRNLGDALKWINDHRETAEATR